MKLSIIVPVYNGENFIKRAYSSIKSQNIENHEYEIIFVNNNSTDNSEKLINELILLDTKVKIYNQPKQGEANARNKGIEKAKGKYLHQLDVDDELFPGALNKMIQVLDENPNVDAVVGRMAKSHKDLANTIKPADETDEVFFKEKPYWGMKWFTSLRNVVGEAAFLHRKAIFEKIGHYNTNISMGTDTAIDIKLGMLCNVAYINTYIYLYYKHFDSITAVSKRKHNQIYHLWSRSIHADLPLYYEHTVPEAYKIKLFNQVFSTMGKIIFYSEGFKERYKVYKQIPIEVNPLKVPIIIKMYLFLLVLIPLSVLLKFYVYYFSKWIVKLNFKNL